MLSMLHQFLIIINRDKSMLVVPNSKLNQFYFKLYLLPFHLAFKVIITQNLALI